ncbi:SpoIIE family protein phosphatase [Evansella sp. AB-P1]|uniref:SpoIIE family protein phosphatase n=1 Tax=Evansella sp. AB-P1 TaxID=3037653 RepID=UPI00241BF54C|nr:SpoIIE family protein phosphatase [Evansella sp. AB-P1]MDG5787933.1 SpoIIE family protein phosphatase [Evansella sp. AB-P1]
MIERQHLEKVDISLYQNAKKGNWCSGDSIFTVSTKDYVLCAVADGLGSGEEAMDASSAAIESIKMNHHLDVALIMSHCNKTLAHKRGTVIGVLKINFPNKEIIYCNVGNIGCAFYPPSGKLERPIPIRGYLSGKQQKFKIQHLYYEPGTSFILYTDGLIFNPAYHSCLFDLNTPELMMEHIVNDMKESNDDTAIVIGKILD